jgi:hypothetical protein
MSRCLNCRCELPHSETLCPKCFDAEYEQMVHPKSWWERRRVFRHWPRLTRYTLYSFLLAFVFVFLRLRFGYHPPTTENSALLASAFALVAALIQSTSEYPDSISNKIKKSPESSGHK